MAITNKYVNASGSGAADGSSEADAMSWAAMVTAINAGGTAGNRYNVKGAVSRTTNADTISGSGTATSPVIIRGYSSVIGDGYLGRTNGNGPLITTNMPAVSYTTGQMNVSGSWVLVESLNLSGARNGTLFTVSPNGAVSRCKILNASIGGNSVALAPSTNSIISNNDLEVTGSSGGSAVLAAASGPRFVGNRIRSASINGLHLSGTNLYYVAGNTIYRCNAVGIALTSIGTLLTGLNNTIALCAGDGIDIVTGSIALHHLEGNLITDNGGYGIDGVSAANAVFAAYNRLDRNTSGPTNLATDWLAGTNYGHNTTNVLQAAEYVDAANDDYRLMSTSPALGAGHFPYADIGALQRVAQAGGAPLSRIWTGM